MEVKKDIKPTAEPAEIERQEPGYLREMDLKVAERVMGWQRQEGYNYWMSFPAGETFKLHALIATWKPSDSIETAFSVVDRMVSDGHIFIIKGDGLRTGDHNPRWTILVDNHPRIDGHHLPETICRAALAAKAAEVNTR